MTGVEKSRREWEKGRLRRWFEGVNYKSGLTGRMFRNSVDDHWEGVIRDWCAICDGNVWICISFM